MDVGDDRVRHARLNKGCLAMTTTPTIWKDIYAVHAGETNDLDYYNQTISLADGRLLSVWMVDTEPSDDILGSTVSARYLDAEGNVLGDPFTIASGTNSEAIRTPMVVAMADGGYVLSYSDLGDNGAVRYKRFDADGDYVAGGVVAGGAGKPYLSWPQTVVLANGDFMISYFEGEEARWQVVDGATNAVGEPFELVDNDGESLLIRPNSDVLSNGVIASIYFEYDDDKVYTGAGVTGVDPTGDLKFKFHITPADELAYPTYIKGLTGGGFVTILQEPNGKGVRAAIYDNYGAVVKPIFEIATGAGWGDRDAQVVALDDGGFYVAWRHNERNKVSVEGARYSASGELIGEITEITNGRYLDDLSVTNDGRIVVVFAEDDSFYQTILDPRDKTISGSNDSDVITSRVDGAEVFGLGGEDTLIGGAAADTLVGGAGVDVIRGGGGNDVVRVSEGEAGDTIDGGSGKDLLDLAGLATNSAVVNLQTGVWSTSISASALTITAIENVNGGGADDRITGDDAHSNMLYGGAGSDILSGRGGNDTLNGGAGLDTLYGGSGNDVFVLGAGHDAVNDTSGNDTITSTISRSLHDYSAIENLTLLGNSKANGRGTNVDNVIKGNDQANALYGEGGEDKLYGYGGNDTLDGGANADSLYGGAGNDVYIVNSKSDKISEVGGGGVDLVKSSVSWTLGDSFENLTLTGTSKISATGTSGNNFITGNSAHNVLTGGGGRDAFVFVTALSGSNYDTITDFDHVTDRFEIDNAVFKGLATGTLAASAFTLISSGSSTAGVDSSDRILYDRNNGNLYFDRDGSRTDYDRILFAHVDDGRLVTNTDFLVI